MAETVYDAVLGAGNALKQVRSSQYSANGNIILGSASGAIDPSALYGGAADPTCLFETADVAGALALMSVTAGLHVSSGTITIPYNKRANGGAFAAGSSHMTISSANGLIIPVQITASQDNEAVILTVQAIFYSTTGLAVPVTFNTGAALASQSFNAQYDFGPVYVDLGGGSAQIAEATGWTVNTGIVVTPRRFDGGIYPSKVFITQRNPTIEITFEDFDDAAAFGVVYDALTSCAVYGRKRTDGGTHVADATEEHLKFSFGAGISDIRTLGGSERTNGQASIMLTGKTLTASSVSAIP